jgi:hypothetical protein
MKAAVLNKLFRSHLAAQLPGFQLDRNLLFASPAAPILRGFCFESSGFAKDIGYVNVFVQALYVPRNHVTLHCGKRLENAAGARWKLSEEISASDLQSLATALTGDGLQFLARRETPEKLVSAFKLKALLERDPHVRQLVAFSLAKVKRYEAAMKMLKNMRLPAKHALEWEQEVAAQCNMLYDAVVRGEAHADALLQAWEAETAHAILRAR